MWGTEYVSDSALTSVVTELRQTFGDDPANPWLLQTIPKQGYRLIAPVHPASESTIDLQRRRDGVRRAAHVALFAAAGVGVVLLAIWAASSHAEPPHSHDVARAAVDVGPAKSLWTAGPLPYLTGRPIRTAFALSPDGRLLVFSAVDQNDRPQLYLRQLDELTARPIGNGAGATPVFSPMGAGSRIGCTRSNSTVLPPRRDLLKVSLDGAPPIRLTSTTVPLGMSWMGDGSIVAGVGRRWTGQRCASQWRAAAHHSASKRRAESPTTARVAGQPQRLVRLSAKSTVGMMRSSLSRISTGARRKLVDAADGRYVEPGYLAFRSSDA